MKPMESTEVKDNTDYMEITQQQCRFTREEIHICMISITVVGFGIVAVSVALLVSVIGGTLTQVYICQQSVCDINPLSACNITRGTVKLPNHLVSVFSQYVPQDLCTIRLKSILPYKKYDDTSNYDVRVKYLIIYRVS